MESLYDPLTHEETLELAVMLDNVEELIKVLYEDRVFTNAAAVDAARLRIRKWVDRLCE